MKIGGVEVSREWTTEPLVFRHGSQLIAFIAEPVHDWDEFNALCPQPDTTQFGRYEKTPEGVKFVVDHEAPALKDVRKKRAKLMDEYLIIKSLAPSNIEWQNVKLDDPETWQNAEKELRTVLTTHEYNLVVKLVLDANALDQESLEENRKSFFQRLSAPPPDLPTGRAAEVASSASSELANGSASYPPASDRPGTIAGGEPVSTC